MNEPTKRTGFNAVIDRVRKFAGMSRQEARALLEEIAVEVARQALIKQQRVVWPRLGAFRAFTTKHRCIDLQALKQAGYLGESAPASADVPPMRKLRFRPAKWHALLKGVQP